MDPRAPSPSIRGHPWRVQRTRMVGHQRLRAGLKKVAMSRTCRAVVPLLLLSGILFLSFTLSPAQSRMKSSHSQRTLPQPPSPRLKQGVPARARDERPKVRGRNRVTKKDTQAPTQLPQFFDAPLYPALGAYGGALTADFNGDGKPDLLMNQSILLGNGDGTFQPPKRQVVDAALTESVAVGDFNNDGKLDLAVVPNLTIQLGNGDGTFQVSASYTLGGWDDFSTEKIAVSDFNGDGKLDLAAVYDAKDIYGTYSPVVGILLGNGDGTFQPHQDFPVENANSVAVGDFNGDGKPDVAVVTGGSVDVLLGNGDGTLQPYVTYPVPNSGNIAVGSLRGNGQLDLVITCSDVTVRVLLGNGDGTFQPQTAYGTVGAIAWYYGAPVIGDFNGDGALDVAFVNDGKNQAGVLFGNGDGSFGAELFFGAGPGPRSLTVGDFNGDGKLDLATESYSADSVGVLLGNGDGTFQTRSDYNVYGAASGVAVGDFNGDGTLDLAVPTVCWIPSRCTPTTDFDTVDIFLGHPDGTFSAAASYAVQATNEWIDTPVAESSIVAADLNHDGKLDLVVANFQDSWGADTGQYNNVLKLIVLLGNGDGTFQTHSDYAGAEVSQDQGEPYEGASVAVVDLNGDGNLDVVATGPQLGAVVWLGNGDGTFRPSVQYSNTGGGSSSVAVGDFNGDGIPDLAVTNGTAYEVYSHDNDYPQCGGTTVSVLLGRGDGSFGQPVAYETAFDPESIAVGDLDGDGKLDLVVLGGVGVNCGTSSPTPLSILLGKGDGTFQKAMNFAIENLPEQQAGYPVAVSLGDFNLDGKLDVVVGSGYEGAIIGLLLGNGDGTFQAPTTYGTGTEPYVIAVGDLNHDGKPDLAAANMSSGTVSVLRNLQGPDFSVQAAGVGAITRGQSASSTLTINSILGYSNSVALTCAVSLTSGTGTAPTCSLSPASVQLAANGSATSTLTINTSASATRFNDPPFGQDGRKRFALWFSISGMAFAMVWTTRIRKNKLAILLAGTLLAALLVLSACGNSGGGGTSGGGGGGGGGGTGQDATYSVTVSATSGNLIRVTTLTVAVQ